MGVNKGGDLTSTIDNLTFAQLYAIACTRAAEAGRSGTPAVAVDLNWVVLKSQQKSVDATLTLVNAFIRKFLDEGFHVHAVHDPEDRHDAKKASIVRAYDRISKVNNAVRSKARLMTVSRKIREETFSDQLGKKCLVEERSLLNKKIDSLEKGIQSDTHWDVICAVRDMVTTLRGQFEDQLFVHEGAFQADSVIQRFLFRQQPPRSGSFHSFKGHGH